VLHSALLAGGSARRYGSDKRLALVGGEPLIARTFRVVSAVGPPVVLVADAADEASVRPVLPTSARFLHDGGRHAAEPRGSGEDLSSGVGRDGPLVALRGLLGTLAQGDAALVVASDLPNLSATFVVALAARAGQERGAMVVPRWDGVLQVACAVYPAGALGSVRSAVAAGERSLTRWVVACATPDANGGAHEVAAPRVAVVEEAEWRGWGGGASPFFNLNTPEDLERLAHPPAGD
jgi:molybdopterin-guanine dinucleotide biosynthesis protein A